MKKLTIKILISIPDEYEISETNLKTEGNYRSKRININNLNNII
jgi:hypothetical protein